MDTRKIMELAIEILEVRHRLDDATMKKYGLGVIFQNARDIVTIIEMYEWGR